MAIHLGTCWASKWQVETLWTFDATLGQLGKFGGSKNMNDSYRSPLSSQQSPEELLRESRWVERLALRLVGDAAAAEDLSQEAMLVAMRKRPDLGRNPRPWLGAVVYRLALRWRRDRARGNQRRERSVHASEDGGLVNELASDLPSTAELVAQADLRRWVGEEALKLPEPGRTIVLLRYFRGLTAAEIAREQGLPAGTVRSRLKRALDDLRQRMDERDGEQSDPERAHWSVTALSFAAAQSLGPLPSDQSVPCPSPSSPSLPVLELVMASKATVLGVAAACVAAATIGFWWSKGGGQFAGIDLGLTPGFVDRAQVAGSKDAASARVGVADRTVMVAAQSIANPASPEIAADSGLLAPAKVLARIVDVNGNGVPGAELRMHGTSQQVNSDANGNVRMSVRLEGNPRSVVFVASHPGLSQRFENGMTPRNGPRKYASQSARNRAG